MLDQIANNMTEFSRQLERLAILIDADVEKVVRLAVLKVFRKIILISPVDTGAYRSSHGIVSGREPGDKENIKTGGDSPFDTDEWNFRIEDGFIVIFNNQPYAERLENGWSGQAPQGIYSIALEEFNRIFAEEIKNFGELEKYDTGGY